MIGYKHLLIIVLFLLFLFPVQVGAKKRRSRKAKPKSKPAVIVQTDSTGQLIRKKRTPEELFDALNSVLEKMTEDMDEFNFDKIHPHLKIVYALYNELRLLALEDKDSLFGNSSSSAGNSASKNSKAIAYSETNYSESFNRDTSSSASDSSLKIVIDQPNPADVSALEILQIKPEYMDPSKVLKDKITGNKASSFSLSWSDTSLSTYLIKFEVTQDSLGSFGWNIVFEKVDKLKDKTVKVHKFFDAGEFSISIQDLVWLIDEVKKAEVEIKNFFYAKEKEKKGNR